MTLELGPREERPCTMLINAFSKFKHLDHGYNVMVGTWTTLIKYYKHTLNT